MPLAPEHADIRLADSGFDVAAAVSAVSCPSAGGIDVFIGITREQDDSTQGTLTALEYHAYPEMALKEMRKLVDQAAAQWPVQRVVLWHRVGMVPVGDASVLIAISCPHRAEAFDACRFIIDALKQTVPLWKKEHFTQNSRWQGDV